VIGWLIYGTLVGRLRRLRSVSLAVQRGQTDTRVAVDGRDEITDVSTSVNAMLDVIVGLLNETRVQRDVLINAAERLFADLRLANGGEFDVKTAVSNDPIWMLGHAFNFTIGRFRRFVLRNQTTIEQLDVVSQQGMDKANAFLTNARKLLGNPASFSPLPSFRGLGDMSSKGNSATLHESMADGNVSFVHQVKGIRDQLQQFAHQNIEPLGASLLDVLEQASRLCQQVMAEQLSRNAVPDRNTIQGIRSLEALLGHLGTTVQSFQKNTAQGLAEVYANVNQLSMTARSAGTENARNSAGSSPGLTATQVQELARLTEGFAREVTGLAQSLRRITEEMRTSLAPFRLEVTQGSQQPNPVSEISRRGSPPPNSVSQRGRRSRQQPDPITEPDWLKSDGF
jgi:HAMP domain-containing protein